MSGSGISWAICMSAPRSRQIPCQHPTAQFFTGRMPFLPLNQQHQSTEGTSNGSLPSDLWLASPAGWLPRTGISSGTLRSVMEYGLALPLPYSFYTAASLSCKHGTACICCWAPCCGPVLRPDCVKVASPLLQQDRQTDRHITIT